MASDGSAGVRYVGTLVGESTSREFRLAVAHETIREQDIIAVDAELRPPDGMSPPELLRIWAKVQRIERINPLFPTTSPTIWPQELASSTMRTAGKRSSSRWVTEQTVPESGGASARSVRRGAGQHVR